MNIPTTYFQIHFFELLTLLKCWICILTIIAQNLLQCQFASQYEQEDFFSDKQVGYLLRNLKHDYLYLDNLLLGYKKRMRKGLKM